MATATALNSTQLHILQMFSYNHNENHLKEMEEVLLMHIRKKVDEEGKRLWVEKGMSNELMDEWLNTHIRTPYNR
jgi:hypothetical protein